MGEIAAVLLSAALSAAAAVVGFSFVMGRRYQRHADRLAKCETDLNGIARRGRGTISLLAQEMDEKERRRRAVELLEGK